MTDWDSRGTNRDPVGMRPVVHHRLHLLQGLFTINWHVYISMVRMSNELDMLFQNSVFIYQLLQIQAEMMDGLLLIPFI